MSSASNALRISNLANVYFAFCVLISLVLLGSELTQDPDLYRTRWSIISTTILLIPSLCCYVFAYDSSIARSYWLCFWTFAYLSFLVHAVFAVFIIFHGVADTFKQQGAVLAGTNFLVLIWWGVDILMAWTLDFDRVWVQRWRFILSLFVFIVWFVTLIFLRDGEVKYLGITMAVLVALCVLVRLFFWTQEVAGSPI